MKNLSRQEKCEIAPCILSDHQGLKLAVDGNRSVVSTHSWELNNSLWHEILVKTEVMKERENFLKLNESGTTAYQN